MPTQKLKLLNPFGQGFYARQMFGEVVEVIEERCTGEKDLIRAIRDVDILMGDVGIEVNRNVINAADRLKAVVCTSIGVDFVDLEAATERGVFVTNDPVFCVVAVAEHALGLMLAIARKIVRAHLAAVSGNWSMRGKFRGVEFEGKTLGIIGIGKIGRSLASKAKGIGMNVIAYHPRPYTKEEVAHRLGIIITDDLEAFMKGSDVISLSVPLKDSTKGLIGEKELRMMKKSAFIINCSRGPVIDEKALTKALKEKWIVGAALDVLEKEPPDTNNPLLNLENVVITPHIGWNTREAGERVSALAREQVISIVNGEIPKNLVNKEVLQRSDLNLGSE